MSRLAELLLTQPATATMVVSGAASARVDLSAKGKFFRITSDGSAYLKLGDVTVVAAATDFHFHIAPGQEVQVFRGTHTHLAHIDDAPAANISIMGIT